MARVNYKRLTERVVLSQVVRTNNSSGGSTAAHQPQITTFASVEPKRSFMIHENGRMSKEQVYEVRIRDRSDLNITPKWNLEWRGNRYQINSDPEIDVKNRMLILTVTRAS